MGIRGIRGIMFLGDKVQVLTQEAACFGSSYPVGTIGYVVYIRYRYDSAQNYYCQYKIALEKHFTGINDLQHLYLDTDLSKV